MQRHLIAFGVGAFLAAAAHAQPAMPLVVQHARVIDAINDATTYVSEVVQACAVASNLSEGQAKGRFEAYLLKNGPMLERAEAWARDAEARLKAQGEARALERRHSDAGLAAVDAAAQRARRDIRGAPDRALACSGKLAEIAAGRFDLSVNAELVSIIGR
jgi:hypothetical protein